MKKAPLKNLGSFLFLFLLAAGIVSCSKDDSNDPAPVDAAGVEGSWQLTAMNVDPAQNGITDVLAFYEAFAGNKCLTQTTFMFKSGGTIDAKVPTGCTDVASEAGVLEDSSKWSVKDKKLQLVDGTDITEYDLEVNKTEMKWSTMEEDNGAKYKITLVFKRV